jgi:hypothetical protein
MAYPSKMYKFNFLFVFIAIDIFLYVDLDLSSTASFFSGHFLHIHITIESHSLSKDFREIRPISHVNRCLSCFCLNSTK